MRRSRIGIGKPSVKDRRVIILGSVGYMASVTTTELCHYSWEKKKPMRWQGPHPGYTDANVGSFVTVKAVDLE